MKLFTLRQLVAENSAAIIFNVVKINAVEQNKLHLMNTYECHCDACLGDKTKMEE